MKRKHLTFIALSLFCSLRLHAMGPQAPGGGSTPPSKYAHLDPKHFVPRELLNTALDYYDSHQSQIANKKYISVIDFSKYSGQKRFFVINMESGEVETLNTAHGKGSDPSNTGYAEKFSNTSGSQMTSLGFYLTGSTYNGSNGLSLYLDGLSASNSKARSRAIVIHGANYVGPQYEKMGRSWGCPALDDSESSRIITKIKGKSLIYAAN